MAGGRCQIRRGEQCQCGVARMIVKDTTLQGDDWECCIMNSVGEALSNLAKAGKDGCVIWKDIDRGLEVVLITASYDDFEPLALMLGHAQESVNRGIGANFIAEEHGLGHYMIAGLTSQSCYSEGRLTLRYFEDDLPKLDCLKLVSLCG